MSDAIPARRRGRPGAPGKGARVRILDATCRILGRAPTSLPSLRRVAQEAGVSPALLHYHFEDLTGLMRCLHDERALPLLQPLLQDLRASAPDAGAALTRFMQKWTALGLRNPWLMPVLLQAPAGAAEPGWRITDVVRAAVARAQEQGSVRNDLADDYIARLLLCLGALPHLAQTRLAAGIDVRPMDAQDASTLALQHLAVLQAGLARTHRPRQDSTS